MGDRWEELKSEVGKGGVELEFVYKDKEGRKVEGMGLWKDGYRLKGREIRGE